VCARAGARGCVREGACMN